MVVGKYSFAYLGSGVKNQYWYFSIKIWTLPIKSSCPWFPLLPPSPQISLDSLTVHCIYPFVWAGKRVQSLLPKHRTQYLRIIFTYVFTWWKTLFFFWGRKAAARCWFYLIDLWNIIVWNESFEISLHLFTGVYILTLVLWRPIEYQTQGNHW